MWSRAAVKSKVEQKRHRRRKGKGREPSIVPDKAWPGTGNGGDRRLRSLRSERSHHAVTGSVASGVGAETGARG
jgi:hypothetical protein